MRAYTISTLFAFLSAGSCLANSAVIVVNQSVNASSLSAKEVENVFLGKKTKWDSGGAIKVAILEGEQAAFVQTITGKTPTQLATLWKKLVFTGQGSMPKIFKTEDELVSYIANTPGACGYASEAKANGKVKEVRIE